ncbi:MAG: tetratricopeptide repeat protein [Anaerolineaceae bacterium]|nr:tetratricopeptide repeat protein [Anaerolineaceae bacterium]
MGETKLIKAIQLAQSGNRPNARRLLLKIIQEHPGNEIAWLWLVDVCDKNDERKAILIRALHQNPGSKLLRHAYSQFARTGTLDTSFLHKKKFTQALIDLSEIDTADEDEIPFSDLHAQPKRVDLDWIELEEEDEESLETISDEEFSLLSHTYFDAYVGEEPEVSDLEQVDSGELGILKDYLHSSVPELEATSDDIEGFSDVFEEEEPGEGGSQSIEIDLKQAFIDMSAKEEKSRRKRKAISGSLNRVIIILGSLFWLLILVVGGLYLNKRYNIIGPNRNQEDVPEETALPESEEEILESNETETSGATPETTPSSENTEVIPDATEEIVYSSNIQRDTIGQIVNLGFLPGDGLINTNEDWSVVTMIQPTGIGVYDESFNEFAVFSDTQSDYLSECELSGDGRLLVGFSPYFALYIWDVENNQLLQRIDVPFEYLENNDDGIVSLVHAKPTIVISPDQSKIGLGYWGGVFVWSVEDGSLLYSFTLDDAELNALKNERNLNFSISFSENSEIVYYGGVKQVSAYNFVEEEILWKVWTAFIVSIETMPSNRLMEAGYHENPPTNTQYLRLRDSLSGKIMSEYLYEAGNLDGYKGGTYKYLVEQNKLLIAEDGECCGLVQIAVVDIETGERIAVIPLESYQMVYSLGGTENQNLIAVWYVHQHEAVFNRARVEFFDLGSGQSVGICEDCQLRTPFEPTSRSLNISPDGKNLVMCAIGHGCSQFGIAEQ